MKKLFSQCSFLEIFVIIWALFLGTTGLLLYFLGIFGLWYRPVLVSVGVAMVIGLAFATAKTGWKQFFRNLLVNLKKDKLLIALAVVLFAFIVLNFLAALAPEIGFDALWYHLTLPKIYLLSHQISSIKGGLLYYSVMPRLTEMLFGLGLAIEPSGILPKLIHLWAGVLWLLGTFIFLRLFLTKRYALLGATAIYATSAVSWLSQTAYIDLMTAFFAVMMFWALFKYLLAKENAFFWLSAIFMGFTLATKTYALLLFGLILFVLIFKVGVRQTLKYAGLALLIVLPFYFQAWLSTGNPVYPVFSVQDSALDQYLGGYHTLKDWYLHVWFFRLPALFWQMLVHQYTPFLGLLLLLPFSQKPKKMFWPVVIFIGFFLLWSLIPTQEPRYFLLILPVGALVAVYSLEKINLKILKFLAITLVLALSVKTWINTYRSFKNPLAVTFGQNSRSNYLVQHLSWSQVYLDEDGSIKKIVGNKKLLTVNIHNLFYLNVPFSDWTFIEDEFKGESPAQVALKLRQKGFQFVIIGGRSTSWWLGKPEAEVNQYFKPVFSNQCFNLYEINSFQN